MSSSDSDSSDSSVKKKKKTKSKRKQKKDTDSDSDSGSDSDKSNKAGSDSDSDNDKGPSRSKKDTAANAAKALALTYEIEYNQLRHAIHHLKRYLVQDRGVNLPTIHLLKEQSGIQLCNDAMQSNKDPSSWIKWLTEWKIEHLDRAKSRYQLLLQLKADMRCFSRSLTSTSTSSSSKSSTEPKETQDVITLPKEWLAAMLSGKNYELLMQEKKDKLDREHDRKERLKKKRAMDNADWEANAEKSASIVQRIWRSRAAYRKIQAMLDEVWEKVYDEGKGGYYYYNRKTDTATWEKPKLLHHEIEGTY